MEKIGLVLEGGAMRGVYTAGALDYFLKHHLHLPYVIAVSAGACQALSYLSKQEGRNKEVTKQYIKDWRYLSYQNLFRNGSIFGFDFMFHDIAEQLIPFDFHTFESSPSEFVIGVTNCESGQADYFYKNSLTTKEVFNACIASSSMPLVSKECIINGKTYLDGGISDPIPIEKAILDGYQKNIVILTRDETYHKKSASFMTKLIKKRYPQFPKLADALAKRHECYNKSVAFIEKLAKQGDVFLIRPKTPVKVSRIEKNERKLAALYKQGFYDAKDSYKACIDWIKDNIG